MDPDKGKRGARGPCLRTRQTQPRALLSHLKSLLPTVDMATSQVPDEAWCAAHLDLLCQSAIRALEEFGTFSTRLVPPITITATAFTPASPGKELLRGLLVPYEALPGIVPSVLLPLLFRVEPSEDWLAAMARESQR